MTTIQYINIVNQCLVIQKPVKMETKTGIFALKNLLCFISVLFITAGILHSQNLAYNTAGNTVSDSCDGVSIRRSTCCPNGEPVLTFGAKTHAK